MRVGDAASLALVAAEAFLRFFVFCISGMFLRSGVANHRMR